MKRILAPENVKIVRYLHPDHPDRLIDDTHYRFVDGYDARRVIVFYLRVYADFIEVSIDYLQNSVIFGEIDDGNLYETHKICAHTPTILRLYGITYTSSPFTNHTLSILLTSLTVELIDGHIHATLNDVHCKVDDLIIEHSSTFGVNLFELMKERGILTIKY